MKKEPPAAHLRIAPEGDQDPRRRSVRIPGGDVLEVTEIDDDAGTVRGTRTVRDHGACRFTGPLKAWESILAGWGEG